MKALILVLLSLNFLFVTPAYSGGTTTPFPFGLDPDDLVGMWTNPTHAATLTIQHIPASKGQREKLFIVIDDRRSISKGYLYFAETQYCGILNHSDGRTSPLCLRSRYGLLTIEANQNRFYFSNHRRLTNK